MVNCTNSKKRERCHIVRKLNYGDSRIASIAVTIGLSDLILPHFANFEKLRYYFFVLLVLIPAFNYITVKQLLIHQKAWTIFWNTTTFRAPSIVIIIITISFSVIFINIIFSISNTMIINISIKIIIIIIRIFGTTIITKFLIITTILISIPIIIIIIIPIFITNITIIIIKILTIIISVIIILYISVNQTDVSDI